MQGETILCVGTVAWGWLLRPVQQIMSRIATCNRVLYFEPGRDPNRPVVSEFRRNSKNFFKLNIKNLQENLILIETPSSLPHGRRQLPLSIARVIIPMVARINARVVIRHIRWATKTLDVTSPILWLNGSQHIGLIGQFNEKLVCYLNADEEADYVENARIKDLVRQMDNDLTRRVDIVFATSRSQWERRKAINSNTYLTPNAVDFKLFNTATDPKLPLPADIASLPRPVIGFAGWLGSQIDVGLLSSVAEAYPSFSLVLVGPDALPKTTSAKQLHARPNVFFLGQKESTQLPAYLKGFDVALIPYVLAGYPLTAYPLKLHEYLAAGRAVVTTAMPELRPFQDVVFIGENSSDFILKIRAALSDQTSKKTDARIAVARENTWDQRVADIYRVLENRLSTT